MSLDGVGTAVTWLSDGAVLWINNKKIILMGDATDAMGLFYDNNKIYVTSIEGHLLEAETELSGILLWP